MFWNLFNRKPSLIQLSYSTLNPEAVAVVHAAEATPYTSGGYTVTVGTDRYRVPTLHCVVVGLISGVVFLYSGSDALTIWEYYKGENDMTLLKIASKSRD